MEEHVDLLEVAGAELVEGSLCGCGGDVEGVMVEVLVGAVGGEGEGGEGGEEEGGELHGGMANESLEERGILNGSKEK